MEFESQSTAAEPQQVTTAEPSPENQSEEEKQLPEELNGLPKEYAEETLAEWEKTQAERQSESAPTEETFTLEQYRAREKEVEELKAKLAEYQKQQPQQQRPQRQQPQARQVQPQFQSPPLRITQEDSRKIAEAITAEAMSISGLSKEDVASLEYADEDDPRVATWNQARSLAQNEVYNTIRQARARQEQQTRQFLADHNAAIDIYNTFAQKEFSEPDFKEIQNFATNEFFNELSPNEQRIIANSYLRVERQIASPADLTRGKGTSIEVSLLMPLNGAGVLEDNQLEGNEEKMNYRSCTVYLSRIRNAVRLAGKFEEQKTQEKMRTDMRKVLSAWISRYLDLSIFAVLTGTNPPFYTTGVSLPYTIEAPTADRRLFAGGKTSEGAITAADVFDTSLIGKARRMAQADELTAVQPIRIDGRETYVMVIDPYQARDLRKDPKWLEAQEHANVRGETNPIFSGAMGIYEGVVIHECLRVPRTETGSNTTVGHALFLGAQACIMAEGEAPRWVEKSFDFDNQYGVSISRMFGLKKAQFKYDGNTLTDFGVINVMTSSVGD